MNENKLINKDTQLVVNTTQNEVENNTDSGDSNKISNNSSQNNNQNPQSNNSRELGYATPKSMHNLNLLFTQSNEKIKPKVTNRT